MNYTVLLRVRPHPEADGPCWPELSDVCLTAAADVSIPVSIVAVAVQDGDDNKAEIVGPLSVLADSDIAEWAAAVILKAGGLRIFSSVLPDARSAELLRLALDWLEERA
jgi:hypothetical protein